MGGGRTLHRFRHYRIADRIKGDADNDKMVDRSDPNLRKKSHQRCMVFSLVGVICGCFPPVI